MPMANLLTDPFAITTVLLASLAWVMALVPSILTAIKHDSNLAIPNFAWYAIAFMFCVIVGVTLIFATENASKRSRNYAIAIVGFLVNSLVLNALAVNNLIYRSKVMTQVAGAGFIILSAIDAIWILYFGSAPSSGLRRTIDGEQELNSRKSDIHRSYDSEASGVPLSVTNGPLTPQPQLHLQLQPQPRPYVPASATESSVSSMNRISSGINVIDHYTRHSESSGAGAGAVNEKTATATTTRAMEVMPAVADGGKDSWHPEIRSSSVYPASEISVAPVQPLPDTRAQRLQQIQQQIQRQQQRPLSDEDVHNDNNITDKGPPSSNRSSSTSRLTTWSYLGEKINSAMDPNRYTTEPNSLTSSRLSPQRAPPKAGGGGIQAKALWAYNANAADPLELSFAQGEEFEVVDKTSVWWKVRKTRDNKEGIAPSNYLSIIS